MRGRIARLVPLAAAAALTACMVNAGQRVERYPVATEPRGLTATLRLEGQRPTIVGELLEVQDTALLLMAERQVLLVPYHRLLHARFEQMPSYRAQWGAPAPAFRRELSLRSRYPQGVSPEILAKLLAITGQSSPAVIGR